MLFQVTPPHKKNGSPQNCQTTFYHLHCFSIKLPLNISMKDISESNYEQKILLFYLHPGRTPMNSDMT